MHALLTPHSSPPLALVRQVTSKHRGEGAKAGGCLHVAHDSHDNDGGRLEDGDSLNDLLLVHLGPGAVHLTGDVSHARLQVENRIAAFC